MHFHMIQGMCRVNSICFDSLSSDHIFTYIISHLHLHVLYLHILHIFIIYYTKHEIIEGELIIITVANAF